MTNVLLIITDDQRLVPDGDGNSTLDVMPNLMAEMRDRGIEFPNMNVTTPLCDPSRCSIYSGLFASEHGCVGNDAEAEWDQNLSIQRILQGNGYRTGLIGKFTTGVGAVPAEFFDFVGDIPQSASEMEIMLELLDEFFSDPDPRPWFFVLSTSVPHRPYNATPVVPITLPTFVYPDSAAEVSLTDKHSTVQTQASKYDPDLALEDFEGQLNELAAFDEVVPQVFGRFTADQRDEMLVVFTSDNGYEWGEHRLKIKDWPYIESMSVPLFISWPAVLDEGASDGRLVANIDLAPTILDALGITADYEMSGFSLLTDKAREWLYTEIPDPAFVRRCRTYFKPGARHYIDWLDGERVEDYDLSVDPTEELASNVRDPTIDALLDNSTAIPEGPKPPNAALVTVRPPTACG